VDKSPVTPPVKKRFFYGYPIVIVSFFTLMIVYGVLYSYGVFMKPIVNELGWTRATTSGAYSLGMIVTGYLFMVTGQFNDVIGPRRLITICGFLLGAGCLLMSLVQAAWQLYVFWGLIIGTGVSGGIVPITSTVARWFIKKRGLMTGLALAGIGFSQVAFPPLITLSITAYGWRTAFAIFGGFVLVALISLAQLLRRDPQTMGQHPDGESTPKPESTAQVTGFLLGEALFSRQLWLMCAAYFSHGYFLNSALVHIVPHATDLGIPALTASSIMGFIGGLSIVGRIGIGSASDRVGNRPTLIASFILTTVSLLWLQVARELWMLYLFAVLFGIAYGGEIALLSPTVARLFGLTAHGSILGIVFFFTSLGGALGPLLAGKIFDLTGTYYASFWVSTALAAAGVMFMVMLKPTHHSAIL